MRDTTLIEEKMHDLIRLTNQFCDNFLDDEYKNLCKKLIRKMARKHIVPFLSGRIEIWAASIIHALGRTNFLFDRNSNPHISAADISNYFNTSKNTISQKAKIILNMFKIRYWDKEFSTSIVKESDPFSNLVFINGLPFDKQNLPPKIQEIVNIFQSEEDLTKEYKKYRNLSNNLVSKIIDTYINEDILINAGTLLDITKGNQLLYNSTLEKHALIDFTLFDFKTHNKSFIALYQNKIKKNEREILENLLSSYTSLFIIRDIKLKEHLLILDDLLNNWNNLKLIDINLSQTTIPGILLFTRLIPFKDFYITSGVNFAFQNALKNDLFKEYNSLYDNIRYDDPAIKRFISFFKLNRFKGFKVIPLNV